MSNPDIKLAIFASGSGSTAEVLFNRATVVITNNKNAGVLERVGRYNAEHCGCIMTYWIPRFRNQVRYKDGQIDPVMSELAYGQELLQVLRLYKPDFISLNGFAVKLPWNVVKEYHGRVANSHPAPLRFKRLGFGGQGMYGLAPHGAVQNFYERIDRPFVTEATEHLVTSEYDQGPELAFTEIELIRGESPIDLQKRVISAEKIQLVEFWNQVARDGWLKPLPKRPALIQHHERKLWSEVRSQAIEKYIHH